MGQEIQQKQMRMDTIYSERKKEMTGDTEEGRRKRKG
jgi:hypothetical protein